MLPFFKTLRAKILSVYVLSFLLAGIVLMISIFLNVKPDLENKFRKNLYETTELVSMMLRMRIQSTVKNHLMSIAERSHKMAEYNYDRYKSGEISEEDAYARFKNMLLDEKYGKIGDTGYLAGVDSKGVLVIHPKSEGVNASKFEFMQRAMSMKNGYLEYDWKNRGEDKARKKAGAMRYFEPWDVIVWASSYRAEFLKLIEMENIQKIIANVTIGQSGYAGIYDGNMNYIGAEKDKFYIGKSEKQYLDSYFEKAKLLAKASSEEDGETAESKEEVNERKESFFDKLPIIGNSSKSSNANEKKYNKMVLTRVPFGLKKAQSEVPHFLSINYIPEMDFFFVSAIPVAETVESVNKTLLWIIITVIVGSILSTLAAAVVIGRILKPVDTIKEVSSSVSEGDLKSRADAHDRDEIGQMSKYFNVIIDNFSEVLSRIKDTSDVLNNSIQDLSSSSQEIATTSNEQAAAVKEIVSTMEDSDALAKSVANKIVEVTKVSTDTSEIVNEGFQVIKNSLSKMDEIKNANTETISGIKQLGEQIESIWDIVNIINNIADQTKIIAFNAELEASAAGEAGKNFQIVATEIRRLADNTVSSTNEIKNKINEIQHSSDRLIITSENGTEKIKQGSELTDNLRNRFDDILRSSDVSKRSSEEISTSIKQQVSAFEQILLTLKQISQGIENFTISTKSLTDSAQDLKENASRLKEVLGRYRTEEENAKINDNAE